MRYLAVIFLVGCAPSIPGNDMAMDMFPEELSAAVAEWTYTMPHSAECAAPYVVMADDQLLDRFCGHHDVLGCHSVSWGRHVIVVNAAEPAEARNTVTHEAMHWLADCSGDFADDQEAHDDPTIWGPGGILERVNESLSLPTDQSIQ